MSSLVGFCQRFVGWGLCVRKLQSAGVMDRCTTRLHGPLCRFSAALGEFSNTSKSFGPFDGPGRSLFAGLRRNDVMCSVSDMGKLISLRVEVEG